MGFEVLVGAVRDIEEDGGGRFCKERSGCGDVGAYPGLSGCGVVCGVDADEVLCLGGGDAGG